MLQFTLQQCWEYVRWLTTLRCPTISSFLRPFIDSPFEAWVAVSWAILAAATVSSMVCSSLVSATALLNSMLSYNLVAHYLCPR